MTLVRGTVISTGQRTNTLLLRFTAQGRRLLARLARENLARQRKHRRLRTLRLTLTTRLAPKHGRPVSVKRSFTITPRVPRRHTHHHR